jgi:hypothetical protein
LDSALKSKKLIYKQLKREIKELDERAITLKKELEDIECELD